MPPGLPSVLWFDTLRPYLAPPDLLKIDGASLSADKHKLAASLTFNQ
jgi:hypothetical protein